MTKNPSKTSPARRARDLGRHAGRSGTARRAVRHAPARSGSAVKRVAILLGESRPPFRSIWRRSARGWPPSIRWRSAFRKRLANIRSDFLAAVKASGRRCRDRGSRPSRLEPVLELICSSGLSGRRAHIGLSRLARYASATGDRAARTSTTRSSSGFIAAVRARVAAPQTRRPAPAGDLIWNEAARDPRAWSPVGDGPVVPWPAQADRLGESDRGLPQGRGRLSVLVRRLSDPFAADARSRPLAPRTLRLRRDQIHAAVTALVESGTKPAAILSAGRSGLARKTSKPSCGMRLESVSGANEHLQLQPRQGACSDCLRVGEGRPAGVRRTQASSRQDAGASSWADRQEQAVPATVRRSSRIAAPLRAARPALGRGEARPASPTSGRWPRRRRRLPSRSCATCRCGRKI